MDERLRVGIDIDGVLYPFNECANEALIAKFGIPDPGPWRYWSYVKDVITPEQWAWLWTQEGQWASLQQVDRVYPGAVEMVNALTRNPDNDVHFVTHRDPRRAGGSTLAFLLRHFSAHPWAGVHVLQNSTPKRGLAEWDVFIDDKVETVEDMLLFTKAHVFAPQRPWNIELARYVSEPWCRRRFTYYEDPAEVADWALSQ